MSNTTNSITLPDGLSEDVRQELLALTKETQPEPFPFPVNEQFIRHWCETLEDGNPLYIDEDYARQNGLDGLMLPPLSVLAAAQQIRWPWPPKIELAEHILFRLKRILNLPIGIATECEQVFYAPIQVGDNLFKTCYLTDFSPWKKTRLGEGHFITWSDSYINQHGVKVAEQLMTVFAYGRGVGGAEAPKLLGGFSNAIEEAIEGTKTGYKPPELKKVLWEDVKEGDELPSIRMPITMTRLVYLASATRDFSPQHSNSEYAKTRSKTRDAFVNTQFNMGMVSRLATDWAGPSATVRSVKIKMKENVCRGDDMIVTGKVTQKYEKDGEHLVVIDVMISNQDSPCSPAVATIALPSRTGASK